MKNFLIFILVLLFASCKAETPMPLSQFDADISIQINGREYTAVYQKRQNTDKLIFSSPERLNGLDVSLSGGVCTVTMADVSFESESLAAMFDFLPVATECEKTVGNRQYRIYNLRGVK